MSSAIRIGLVGDYDPAFPPHQATVAALEHSAALLQLDLEAVWIATPALEPFDAAVLRECAAIWCAPGSPFRSMLGALSAIRYARERGLPFLGTCAGFQHMVIEYARNVMGKADAQHAEYAPLDGTLFVTPLSCPIRGTTLEVIVEPGSQAGRAYGRTTAMEQYYCSFGLNPAYQEQLDHYGLRVVGVDRDGEARILELPEHPFFVGTLFVPQMLSRPVQPHPLISAFVQAARSGRTSGHQAMRISQSPEPIHA
jgi:CTP synthase (UTP-ammonia lyase)